MSLPDTIFIFALALVIFGPKKLPEIGRQIGKLVFEFRRASNEFKMQMEEELRAAEQSERQKQLSAPAPAPPAATVTPSEPPSEELTIRAPSTGTLVSTDSPSSRVTPSPEENVDVEPAQPDQAALSFGETDRLEEQTANHHG